jgi:hypothetical protein
MLNPADINTLGSLLQDEPLTTEWLTDLETEKLDDFGSLNGMHKWLEHRKEKWKAIEMDGGETFTDYNSYEFGLRWAKDHKVRWAYWKRQTVYEWLRDDHSGGKLNPLLLPQSPTIDDYAWNFGLSSADREYSKHCPARPRARWMRQVSGKGDIKKLKRGKFDFFKLLVWDLLLNKLLREVSEDALDALLNSLQPMSPQVRMDMVMKRIKGADIAVLIEVPADEKALPVEEKEFHRIMAPKDEGSSPLNTVILARKELFKSAKVHTYTDSGGRINHRVIGCTLTPHGDASSKNPAEDIHVLGVHLSGKGHDGEYMASKIENTLRPETILLGDFNTDLRMGVPKWVDPKMMPQLWELVGQAKQQYKHLASTNKQRSPFQAQVSKMFLQDFSMKDFVFLGNSYRPAYLDGLINRQELLPNREIPSDHTPLEFELSFADFRASKVEG